MAGSGEQTRVKTIFLGAICFVIALSVLSFFRVTNLIEEGNLVIHTNKVKLTLEKIAKAIINAETNQKSHLITGDRIVLLERDQALRRLDLNLDLADSLLQDNSVQTQNLKVLRLLVERKRQSMRSIIDGYSPIPTPEVKAYIIEGIGFTKDIMDHINQMQKVEDRLLEERQDSLTKSATLTPVFTIILILGALVILVASYLKIAQALNTSDRLKTAVTMSEKRIQTILEYAPDAVITIDANGDILTWNPQAENIFGWKKEEVQAKPLSNTLFPGRYTDAQAQIIGRFLATGGGEMVNEPIEMVGINSRGEELPVEIKISSSVVEGNAVFIAFVRDITERKRAQEQLKAQNENLIHINKELESFTYISSHDLQEPLRQIQNFSSRIDLGELSERNQTFVEKINGAANRMQNLILDLLAYSRTSVATRVYENVDLNAILEEVKEDIGEELREKKATIEAEYLGRADVIPFQFRQLLHNLVGNALKFSKPDVPPHIRIQARTVAGANTGQPELDSKTEYCHISLADNGIGFEQQYAERIFALFQRLHDRQKISGTGIGLAIAKKIVENHNGTITATGIPGVGAHFDIFIPLHQG